VELHEVDVIHVEPERRLRRARERAAPLAPRLGVRLIQRSTWKVQLTPEGAVFFERSVRIPRRWMLPSASKPYIKRHGRPRKPAPMSTRSPTLEHKCAPGALRTAAALMLVTRALG